MHNALQVYRNKLFKEINSRLEETFSQFSTI